MLRFKPDSDAQPTLLSPTVALPEDYVRPTLRRSTSGTPAPSSPLGDPLLRYVPTQAGFKVLNEHVFFSTLGRGGMGAVYRARDLRLEIDVAIKCLLPEAEYGGTTALARFEREAHVGSSLDHPNVVQVLRYGHHRGLRYLVMEYVHGETLQRRVHRRGASELGEALGIVQRAARGLAAAHRRGLVHRDIKPANLMLGTAGEVKICDLGLAKGRGFGRHLTSHRSVLGTPRYMAPEQWSDSRSVGPAADVYSLGATLYYLLAGRDRNQGTAIDRIRLMTQTASLTSLESLRASAPSDVVRVIERCMDRNPNRRYPNCQTLACVLNGLAGRYETTLIEAGRETSGALPPHAEPSPETVTALDPRGSTRSAT